MPAQAAAAQEQKCAKGWSDAARAKRKDTREASLKKKAKAAEKKEREQSQRIPRVYLRVFGEGEGDPLKIAATSLLNLIASIQSETHKLVKDVRTRRTDGGPQDSIQTSKELHGWATGAGDLIRGVDVRWRRHHKHGHILWVTQPAVLDACATLGHHVDETRSKAGLVAEPRALLAYWGAGALLAYWGAGALLA
eukprot:gene5321-6638_t